MDLELKDKVVIVGGASKGLGRACADVLAEEGAKLTICSRTASDLEQAAAEIRDSTGAEVLALPADLENYDRIKTLGADHGGPLRPVGYYGQQLRRPPPGRSETATEEQWETAVQRSLFFFARMSREAIPHLRQQGGGAS